MQNTTKMVMIPQDAYTSMISQQKQLYPPIVNQMSSLDQELQSILSNPNLPTDEKYHQYMSTFGRYQQLRQDFYPPIVRPAGNVQSVLPETNTLPIEQNRLLNSLPKTVQRKGKILLDHMKDNNQVFKWTETGELIVDGKPIIGSNVTDLVHHVTRTRPTAAPPTGAVEFKELLNISNAPQEALTEKSTITRTIGTSFSPILSSVKKDLRTPTPPPVKSPVERRPRKKTERWVPY